MKIKFAILLLAFLVILGLISAGKSNKSDFENNSTPFTSEEEKTSDLHDCGFSQYKNIVSRSVFEAGAIQEDLNGNEVQIGVTSHHLPVAAPLIASLYQSFLSSRGPRDTFVILGPDHFEKCKSRVALTEKGYSTPFGDLEINKDVLNEFINQNFSIDNACFKGEHSIGVQAIFLKHAFPDAKIVPILFSSGTSKEDIEKLSAVLSGLGNRTSVIVSVDFSHYNRYEEAKEIDKKSEEIIEEMRGDFLKLKNVDSPAAMQVAFNLAKKEGYNNAQIIKRANSFDYTGRKESTTGYMSVVFQK